MNPGTSVPFVLPERGHVTARVYDTSGRTVRVLVDAGMDAGQHRLTWDGVDARGRVVGEGVLEVHQPIPVIVGT